MTTRRLLVWLFMFGAVSVTAQESSSVDPKAKRDSIRVARKAFEQDRYIKLPYIGIGAGVLNYFGELDHNGRTNPLVNSYGINVSIIQNFSPSFGLKFEYMNARITVNKEDGKWNNFRTGINAGFVQIFYNFARILPQNRIVNPFICVGVGTFNFSSKGDLKSQEGYRYHQHADGSLWNLPDTSAFVGSAIELTRDHVYETDLREQNLDGLGKYNQFTFSVPMTFGINFQISNRASLKMASTFHWTSTDLIDNISSKGEGDRKGDTQNDYILYNSISFFYDFLSPKRVKKTEYDGMAFFSLDGDSDGDGVIDMEDLCPGTPKGAAVSDIGCALDSDEDGVPDGIDKEPNTKSDLPVDAFGIGDKEGMKPTVAADTIATKRNVRYIVYPDLAEMYQVNKQSNSIASGASDLQDFAQFDSDGNGVLSIEEVHNAIDRFFDGELPELTPADLGRLIDHFFDQ